MTVATILQSFKLGHTSAFPMGKRAIKTLSQRTLVEVMRALESIGPPADEMEDGINFTQLLYENDFPDWFIRHSSSRYNFDGRK